MATETTFSTPRYLVEPQDIEGGAATAPLFWG